MPCKHFRSLSGTGPRVPGRWTGSSDSIRFHNASSISHGFAMTVQRANPKPRTAQPVRAPTNLKRVLGEGDRKRTYLARDRKMDRLVAISLVKPEAVLSDPQGTEREAKVLGRIGSHPNVVSLYEYEMGRHGSVEYMIFEYL